MALIECLHCQSTVFRKKDGTCPSCGEHSDTTPALPTLSEEEQRELRVRAASEDLKREQRELEFKAMKRAYHRWWGGALFVFFGVSLSLGSYLLTNEGGRFRLASGSIFWGLIMMARGSPRRPRHQEIPSRD